MPKRKLLFSVTKDDCRFDYYRASGAGGQKRNKTNSAVRCTHIASGAVGNCSEHREQRRNKEVAFERMSKTREFETWRQMESARVTGELDAIKRRVDKQANEAILEIKDQDGRWTKVPLNTELDQGEDYE